MRILVVGGGGREHALVRALRRSPRAPELLCAPGNAGIATEARCLAVGADDVDALVAAARSERVDLTVVGPEGALVAGVADAFAQAGLVLFGPSAAAARLEGSKAWAKEVMAAAGVPTARARTVEEVEAGMAAVASYPVVVKADGLAAGKGVTIAEDAAQARAALEAILVERRLGPARAVVEEHLEGEELSLLALCDGERAVALAPAQDYKRALDGDRGPNTGGMGSYSPVPGIDPARARELSAQVHQPVVDELRRRGTPLRGVLYAGLMLTPDGPRVLEYNVRFGDPETQAVLPRLRSDLVDLLERCTRPGGLAGAQPEWAPGWAVTVVLAGGGYPAGASHGEPIAGLEAVPDGVEVTHAGTARRGGAVVTAGGRVLNVTGLGLDAEAARAAAYAGAAVISFPGKRLRHDIAARAVGRPA